MMAQAMFVFIVSLLLAASVTTMLLAFTAYTSASLSSINSSIKSDLSQWKAGAPFQPQFSNAVQKVVLEWK
ncbi:MAG: hypothetical protein M1465_02130 [Candidatus Marsarchaeota archaeon]|nr:hypothetical protein [Candidatus Marsarchaeota archaeon]